MRINRRAVIAGLTAGVVAGVAAGLAFIPNSSQAAAEVSGPHVANVSSSTIAMNTWHNFASYTATGNVQAQSSAVVSVHGMNNNDVIQIRNSVDGVITWVGDYRTFQVNLTVPAATRWYMLGTGDVMTYQVRVSRSGGGSVTLSSGQAWWMTVPASVPSPTVTTQNPTTEPPTTPPVTPTPTPTPNPPGAFPNPNTTGVPVGTTLTNAASCNVAANATVTGMRFDCDPLVVGANATVRNSEITGRTVMGANATIENSTLLSAGEACDSNAAIGPGDFVARGLEVLGWGDGVRVEDGLEDTLVEDSFFKLCETTTTHGDGIQGYVAGKNNTFRHNTVDQPSGEDLNGVTANVFWADGSDGNFRLENNLLIGGGYTIRVYHDGGLENVVTGNRVVNNSWEFGYGDNNCDTASDPSIMHWVDNDVVTIDANYNVTSTITDNVPCT